MPEVNQIIVSLGKILNVDDTDVPRYALTRILQRAGFEVEEAVSGRECLERVAQICPDLVVLDVQLPDISGFDVCHRLKADPATSHIPVLHLSANFVASQDKAYGLEGGADGYLTQPVEPEELVAHIRALLRMRRAEEAARTLARQWQATFDALSDGVCLLDGNGRIVRSNQALERLLGSTRLTSGACLDEVVAELAGDAQFKALVAADGKRARTTTEMTISGRNISIAFDPVMTEEETQTGMVAIFTDVTDQKTAEARQAEALEKQSHIAETLQRSLLLAVPPDTFPGLSLYTVYEAALEEAMIGGDFYDAFALKDGKVAFIVGDVSGKGLLAASRTAEVKYAFRALLHEFPAPADALNRLNAFVHDSYRLDQTSEETFIVMAVVVLDPMTGQAEFSAAGAEPPLILRAEGHIESVPVIGWPLGITPDAVYDHDQRPLMQGDTILMATDGVTEARRGREFLGWEGLARFAGQADLSLSLMQMGQTILTQVKTFAGGSLRDDACLLLARWTGEASA